MVELIITVGLAVGLAKWYGKAAGRADASVDQLLRLMEEKKRREED